MNRAVHNHRRPIPPPRARASRISAFGFRSSDFRRPARRGLTGCFAVLLALATSRAAAGDSHSVLNTKHNLSISGPGTIRASAETEICVFCHSPHTRLGEPALWNHAMPATSYTPYSSPTLRATVGQPTGSSKLCLSCHDGTVAVGLLQGRSAPISMRNSVLTMPTGGGRLGTDLSGHHPISFRYDSALASTRGQLRDPMALQNNVRLDANRELQCTTCHDPHNDQYGQFLVRDNARSALCLECHSPEQWSSSAHANSPATWNGTGANPWPHTRAKTVADNGCENCHAPHAAGTKPHLLNFAKVEDNCLVCHRGTVAAKNVAADFNKPSAHPLTAASALRTANAGSFAVGGSQVACVDCHDPHATRTSAATAGGVAGSLTRVKGINAAGAAVPAATKEYELCFRCHADAGTRSSSRISRQFSQPNTRLQFNPANQSYHPLLSTTKSQQSRSLVASWAGARQMACTDCHNNDQGPGASGSGANGPHGSRFTPLLERNLVQTDFESESANAYALCYKCHSQSTLLGDRLHGKHVREVKTSCVTCHDSHGVATQPHLINFNTLYVKPNVGRINYQDLGGRAACTLTCHGSAHNNKSY